MAKKKAKNQGKAQAHMMHLTASAKAHETAPKAVVEEAADELFDLSDPDTFRKAFIASEVLNRKY